MYLAVVMSFSGRPLFTGFFCGIKNRSRDFSRGSEPKIVNEGEENTSNEDGAKYVELESFKKFFRRPKFHSKSFRKAISLLFAYASSLEVRKNDLPPELISSDQETMWQFISHRCKQISKEFRKRSTLLETGLKLHEEALSSEDDMDDDQEESEKDDYEEEGEEGVDLLNLKDEDLKDLEREMAAMQGEDENQEGQNEYTIPRKKYPHSAVDDKFFSLAEMNAFLDEQDRAEGQTLNILDSVDDSSTAAADYHYEDFFGKIDGTEESSVTKEKKAKKRSRAKELERMEKKKTVRFAMDEDQSLEEGEGVAIQEENGNTHDTQVLLGDTEESQQETSSLKKSLKRLKETIKKLEEENMAPKSWEMSGEVSAQQREENELLETHLEFDLGMKKG
ncbi:unnamed protein product, partial [Strongylus vulgaris]